MADVTDKQRLLNKMKCLSDFFSKAKQRYGDDASGSFGTKTTSTTNHRQHQLGAQHQQPGSSGTKPGNRVLTGSGTKPGSNVRCSTKSGCGVLNGTDSLSTHLPRHTSATCALTGAKVKPVCMSSADSAPVVATSHKGLAKVLSQRDSLSGNNLHVPPIGAVELEDQRTVVIRRIVVISSNSKPPVGAGKGINSAVQTCSCAKRGVSVKDSSIMPTQHTSPTVALCKSVSDFRNSQRTVVSVPNQAQTSQYQKNVVANKTAQGLSGQKSSANVVSSVQSIGVTKSVKSSRKNEVVSRNAEVAAAREMMQNGLENLKSQLAKLEAAKERKNREVHSKKVMQNEPENLNLKSQQAKLEAAKKRKKCEVCNRAGTSKRDVPSGKAEPELHDNRPCMSGSQQRDQRGAVTDSETDSGAVLGGPVKPERLAPHVKTGCSNHSEVASKSVPYSVNQPQSCTAVLPSSVSEPSLFSCVVSINMGNIASSRTIDKSPCSSPSTSAAKANLEKELKATEEKFQDMRKKMGVMLRESPQKSGQHLVSKKQSHQHSKKNVSNITGTVCTKSTPASMSCANQRPFPAGKWTQQNLPQHKLSEKALVVGNSPSLRSFKMASVKNISSKQMISPCRRKSSTPASSRVRKQTAKGRRAQYSLIRTPSSQTSMSVVQTQGGSQATSSKSFVSRYKVLKISNGSKAGIGEVTVPKKTIVHSPYKLTKLGSKEWPQSPAYISGLSTPLTAKQKAAQFIKSKYKMRKVPLFSSPFHNVAQARRSQHFSPHCTSAFSNCDHAWKLKVIKQRLLSSPSRPYQHSPSFLPTTALRGRHRGRRGGQTACLPVGPWRGAFLPESLSSAWWTHNYTLAKMQRAKAAHVAMQWKKWSRWGQAPDFYHLKVQMYQLKKQQLLERLRLKRQQWKKMASIRNQVYRQSSNLMKTRIASARQERLVMINGVVYRSTSSRLTRTSPSNPTTKSAVSAAFSSCKINTVRGKMSRGRMRTVTLRGAWFTVDARGTKLQRVATNSRRGKTTFVSRDGSGGTTYMQTQGGVSEKTWHNQTQLVVNRVKQRSIYLAARSTKKDIIKGKARKNCLYFSRFGKCSRGDQCPFVHDPAKVAVCTRFLRGTCQVENCPFSHKLSKEKMPVCTFFLKGVCTRDPCPYLHVKVSQGARVCQDFLSGFCPLAEKCQKLHTLTCPQFSKTGTCADGKKCRMLHRKGKGKTGRVRLSGCAQNDSPLAGVKRPAQPGITQDLGKEVGSVSPPKHLRPESSGTLLQPELEFSSPSTSSSLVQEGVVPSPGSVKALGAEELGEEEEPKDASSSSQKLPKMPAFISLADYSLEESPSLRVTCSGSRNSVTTQSKGSSLKIKPYL